MKKNTAPIFYVCNDPERALGLELIVPDFHIVCIDDNPIIDFMKASGAHVFSLSRELGQKNPIFRNSYKLLQEESVQQYIEANTPSGMKPNIVVFKVAPNIEKLCVKKGYNLLNPVATLNRRFENKLSQYEQLKDFGIRFPQTVVGRLGDFEYEHLIEDIGKSLVIQYNRGHTGKGTIFVNSEDDFKKEQRKFPKRLARISQNIKGDYWTINACATRFGVFLGGLSYQITGVEECTQKEGATVGNDWTRKPGERTSQPLSHIHETTINVGEKMKEAGFVGLFGLDFVIDARDDVYFIEVNARQPASTSMHSRLMMWNKEIPLQAFHFAEFLFEDDEDYCTWINRLFDIKLQSGENEVYSEVTVDNAEDVRCCQNHTELVIRYGASQLFIRNALNKKVSAKGGIRPGVYRISDDYVVVAGGGIRKADGSSVGEDEAVLERIRDGYTIDDVRDVDEFLVLAVDKGQDISAGSEVARIQAKDTLLNRDGGLLEWVRLAVRQIKREQL